MINEQRWTIKSAAHELGIKLCTAKYILYQYRKRGKISRKKRNYCLYPLKSSNEVQPETNIQYVFVPYPVYVFCPPLENEATFNLDCKTEWWSDFNALILYRNIYAKSLKKVWNLIHSYSNSFYFILLNIVFLDVIFTFPCSISTFLFCLKLSVL